MMFIIELGIWVPWPMMTAVCLRHRSAWQCMPCHLSCVLCDMNVVCPANVISAKKYIVLHHIILQLEVQGPPGPRLLAGGPTGHLTTSFAHFGHSGRVTYATVIGQCVSHWIVCQLLDSVLAIGQCVSRWVVCQPGFFGYRAVVGITYSTSQDEFHSMTCYCMILQCIILFCMVLHGIICYQMVQRGIAWYCIELQFIIWYWMVLYHIVLHWIV